MARLQSVDSQQQVNQWLRWSAYVVVLVTVLTALAVFWARDRGFDLTDEGYYLQLYAHPEAAPPNAAASQFYHVVDLLSWPFELGIVGYRTMGLLLLLAAGVVLGLAVYRFTDRWFPEYRSTMAPKPVGVSFIALAGLLGYSGVPLTVSYNTLSAVLVQLVIASTLWALSASEDASRTTPVLLAGLSGALVPFLFYTKWPTVLAVSTLVALVTFLTLGRRGWTQMAAYSSTALLVFVAITADVGFGPFSLAGVVDSSTRIAGAAYSPVNLILKYVLRAVHGLLFIVIEDLPRLAALIALFAGGAILRSARGASNRLWWWLVPSAAAIFLLADIPEAAYLNKLDSFKFVVGTALALGLGAFAVQVISTRRLPELWLARWSTRGVLLGAFLLVLLAVPIAGAVGTNNHILVSSVHGGSGYGALIVVGAAAFGAMAGDGSSLRNGLALPVVAVVIAAQVLNGVILDSHRLPTPRTEHTVDVSGIPRLEGIRVDPNGARFLIESHRIVTEETSFDAGDTVLAFALMPGLIYAIDGISPGALWILPVESGKQGLICDALRSAPSDVAATTLLIQNSEASPELADCLTELIPGYPQDFEEAGQVSISGGYGAGTGLGTTLRVLELADS